MLGGVYQTMKDFQKAKSYYEKIIEINPNIPEAYNNLGSIFYENSDLEKSTYNIEKAIEINPDFSNAYFNLGKIYFHKGNNQKAVDCFEKAIEIDPKFEEAIHILGLAYNELGELQKAISCFEKVIEIDSNYVDAHVNLGVVYSKINPEKSIEHYQDALIKRSEIDLQTDKQENKKLLPAINSFFLELTNKCNFHCEFCPSDSQTRLHGYMELSLVRKIFDEIAKKKIVTEVNLHLMGEPTLHPKLNEILEYAKSKNVRVALTTNGSTLVEKRVPKLLNSISGSIIASLMTPTKETYKIRGDVGLSWDRYIGNFRLLVREHLKKISRGDNIQYDIIFRVMVSRDDNSSVAKVLTSSNGVQENYDEWCNFTKTVEKELGLKPFTHQKIDADKTFDMLGEGEREISFYLQKNIKIQFYRVYTFANTRVNDDYKLVPEEKSQFCPHPFTDFGILWNGDVSLCCFDYDATLKVGNVNNHTVEDVMKNTNSKKLRASMHGLEKLHPTCVKCQSSPVKR